MNFAEFATMFAGHEIDNVATPKTSSNVKPKGPKEGEAQDSLRVLITGIVFLIITPSTNWPLKLFSRLFA